jgi:hypothetical protein
MEYNKVRVGEGISQRLAIKQQEVTEEARVTELEKALRAYASGLGLTFEQGPGL